MTTDRASIIKASERYISEEPSAELKKQIADLLHEAKAWDDLSDRMASLLSFGTAGIRGKMEAGYNRMNIVTVFQFAYALGTKLSADSDDQKSVVIGFDGRENSKTFAEEVSRVLRAMDIKTHVFREKVHTPLAAYATKKLIASLGVMITASHNPPQDNGIKLFDGHSAQAHGQVLRQIEENMHRAPLRPDFYHAHIERLGDDNLFYIGDEITSAYLHDVKSTKLFNTNNLRRDIKIAYTPLHGVGKNIFLQALKQEGFSNVLVVKEQAEPDGKFPTVDFPNPEEPNTLDLAHRLGVDNNCDAVLANDPDADRLQVSCPDENGEMKKLSGNEMGAILGFYMLMRAKDRGEVPLVASSIVSSRMLKAMCADLGAHYVDALTGFSNIVQSAIAKEQQCTGRFVFGYEEAIGFLIDRVVLDKDGIHAGVRFMEVLGQLKADNKTIWQLLDELYLRFGVFVNSSWSWRIAGLESRAKMEKIMVHIRSIDPVMVAKLFNASECMKYDLLETQKNNCYERIVANVVIFEIEHRGRLIVRPSGTEPKIKFYVELFDRATDQKMVSIKRSKLVELIVPLKSGINRLFGDEGA